MMDFLMNLNGKVGPFGHFAGLLGSGLFGFIHSVMTPSYQRYAEGASGGSSNSSSPSSADSSSGNSHSSSHTPTTPEVSLADLLGDDFSATTSNKPPSLSDLFE